jgi:hypothetical protein
MAHDVFICHSAKDKATADAVCAVIESNGVRCWIAPRDVTAGMEWSECIIDAIEECRVMVLVFTTNANESSQIRREVERAVNRGVAILPLRIEDILPGRALEYFIGNVHWLDALTPPLESHLQNLAGTVKILLGRLPAHVGPIPHSDPIQSQTPARPSGLTSTFTIPQAPIVPGVAAPPPQSDLRSSTAPLNPSGSVDATPKKPEENQFGAPVQSARQTQTGTRKLPWGIYVVAGLSAAECILWIVGASQDFSRGRVEPIDLVAMLGAALAAVTGYGVIRLLRWARIIRMICSAAEVVLMIAVAQEAFREGGGGLVGWFAMIIGCAWIVAYLMTQQARYLFRKSA